MPDPAEETAADREPAPLVDAREPARYFYTDDGRYNYTDRTRLVVPGENCA